MKENKNNKKDILLNLNKILSNSNTIYLMDFFNLNANQTFFLRKSFYENGVKMIVVKNSLLKKSIKNIKNKKLKSFLPFLKKNTSILFSNNNLGKIVSIIIKKFHSMENIKNPILKIAYVQNDFYIGNNSLDLLVNIKSKEELIIDILHNLINPLNNTILSLSKISNQIYDILKYLSIKK
ncbi:50S ribosomal protein L10 [Blattabacterium cuenoti]|uniref:50S ribosomal protein L10 n=1 Tax=Blattabacterium cuenoti TaxID=1653831 RepID=UPI00163CD380|nr:50S ribosomal protein L10 [Blattabacterium cuenoti]